MKAVIYARTATKEQSVDAQIEACKKLIDANNGVLSEIYVDHGFSGLDDARPSLNKMLDDAESKEFDTVAFSSGSVLHRDIGKFQKLYNHFYEKGISLKWPE